MSQTIRELLVSIGINADVDKVKRFDESIESVKRGMTTVLGVTQKLMVGIAGLIGLQGFSTQAFANETLEIQRQAQALGMTNDSYQKLMRTFEAFGADANDVADAVNTITDRANDAEGGVKSMIDDFGLLGIKVKDLKGKKPEELFNLFADAMGKTTDISKRNTAAVRLLGDDVGRKLLPLLKDGSKGLKAYADDLSRLGVILSDEAIKKSAEYATQSKRLSFALMGIRNTLATSIIPAMTRAAQSTTDYIKANKPLIDEKIKNAVRDISDVMDRLDKMLTRIGGGNKEEGIKRVAGALSSLALGAGLAKLIPILAGIVSVGLVPLLVIGLKIAAVVAIVIALGLAIEDLIIYFRGGPSVTAKMIKGIKDFFDNLRQGNATVDKIITTLEDMGRIASLVFALIERVAQAVFSRLAPFATLVFDQIAAAASFVGESVSAVFTALWENILRPIFTAIGEVFGVTVGVLIQELEFLLENWDAIFGGLGNTVDTVLEGVLGVWKSIFGFMGTAASEMLGSIRDLLIDIMSYVGKAFQGLDKLQSVMPSMDRGFLGRFIAQASGGDTNALNNLPAMQAGANLSVPGRGAGGGVNVEGSTYNIYPSPGMDERGLANKVGKVSQEQNANQARQLRARAGKDR